MGTDALRLGGPMAEYRSEPWAGPPVEVVEPGSPRPTQVTRSSEGGGDAPIADDPPVVSTPVGMACYDCGEAIVAGDRGLLRSCFIRKDAAGKLYGTVEPIHFECDMLGILGCTWGICHCPAPRDALSGQPGINIGEMPRRAAAQLLLGRINISRTVAGLRLM